VSSIFIEDIIEFVGFTAPIIFLQFQPLGLQKTRPSTQSAAEKKTLYTVQAIALTDASCS